ncbi:HAMP domain-containing protein [Legionella geestiana]|uniref:ATP-binding protein n=1 Tax=Legionella geestiana TaxID=45065 RepID=UPI001091D93F|nr:ATP-binding protein [Legionella geestiana]QDQ40940.1 HAMP domain-containing protein [Legionella geestiana]
MRSPTIGLYWKIFISFWLATILVIFTTAWVTSEIAQKASVPAREQVFMDSYANAAVATWESGRKEALDAWLRHTGVSRHMDLYLLTSKGEIFGPTPPSPAIRNISKNLVSDVLDSGIFKSGNLLVSHEILTPSGTAYRLVALSDKPIAHFIQIPWASLAVRLMVATFISGIICYLLSVYLTRPLRSLQQAASALASGKLHTRVGRFSGHGKDEIAELSIEFDRMAEQMESLIHSKHRLLQDISHELRSPLARLQLAIALGQAKAGPNVAEAEFSRMELECHRLGTLISEILEFARLEKAPGLSQMAACELVPLLKDIVNDANFEFTHSGKKACLEHTLPCVMQMDVRLMRRALENIIRNALAYSPKETSVKVSMARMDNEVVIHVDDKGPGVPQDELAKIFDPFYRVDTAREKKTGGFGLGLAIAQEAIRLHHGHIEAHLRPEGGLRVSVFLPDAPVLKD